jgi:hypothetical protein
VVGAEAAASAGPKAAGRWQPRRPMHWCGGRGGGGAGVLVWRSRGGSGSSANDGLSRGGVRADR